MDSEFCVFINTSVNRNQNENQYCILLSYNQESIYKKHCLCAKVSLSFHSIVTKYSFTLPSKPPPCNTTSFLLHHNIHHVHGCPLHCRWVCAITDVILHPGCYTAGCDGCLKGMRLLWRNVVFDTMQWLFKNYEATVDSVLLNETALNA